MRTLAMPYGYPMSTGYSQQGYAGRRQGQDYEQQTYPSQRLENRQPESGYRQTPKDLVYQLIERMDTDGDGKISSKEARGLFLEFFDKFDLDQDGYLERDEIEAALRHYPVLVSRYFGVPGIGTSAVRSSNDANAAPQANETSPR
jgi:hypothetical protein